MPASTFARTGPASRRRFRAPGAQAGPNPALSRSPAGCDQNPAEPSDVMNMIDSARKRPAGDRGLALVDARGFRVCGVPPHNMSHPGDLSVESRIRARRPDGALQAKGHQIAIGGAWSGGSNATTTSIEDGASSVPGCRPRVGSIRLGKIAHADPSLCKPNGNGLTRRSRGEVRCRDDPAGRHSQGSISFSARTGRLGLHPGRVHGDHPVRGGCPGLCRSAMNSRGQVLVGGRGVSCTGGSGRGAADGFLGLSGQVGDSKLPSRSMANPARPLSRSARALPRRRAPGDPRLVGAGGGVRVEFGRFGS